MRSRLWALILRELPFPFREIGTEVVRILTWIDKTGARLWIGFTQAPAWYVVMGTGTAAVFLTAMLFSTAVSNRDPTLVELAVRGQSLAPATRETLEDAGDWAAQDKWRLAHMFVEHRPPRRPVDPRIDSSLVDDFPPSAVPRRASLVSRSGFNPRFDPSRDNQSVDLILPEHEVRLDLAAPRAAEQPKRLVYGQYVREPGAEYRPVRLAGNIRSRDSRLLVQAEWSFGSECDNTPVRPPTRRIIPVPEPQWDEFPPILDLTEDRRPDLSFQMSMLREFLPSTAEFPPRSRFHSVSANSEFPESFESRDRSPLFQADSSPWARSSPNPAERRRPAQAYVDRVDLDDEDFSSFEARDPGFRESSAPSFAEIALRLELEVPDSAVTGSVNRSTLLLQNSGLREIPHILVSESLLGLETVTDAIPLARVNSKENSLERVIEQLEPGRPKRLETVWRPDSEGSRLHSALVTVQAVVGATTEIVRAVAEQPMPSVAPEQFSEPVPLFEPEPRFEAEPVPEPDPVPETHPSLSFDVQTLPRATVDDLVEIGIVVRNTGDVPLHAVRVVARLPSQLKHRRGSEVEYTINTLPVRGSERTVLRVVADSAGRAVCGLHVSAEEPAEANSRAVIDVDARTVRPKVEPVAGVEPAPPKPRPAPRAIPKRPASPPAVPSSNCCCQFQPVVMPCDGWFIP